MATGGPIESVGLDGREFAVAQDAEVNRKLGGYENELAMNGDGTGRLLKSRTAWSLDGLSLVVDDDREDHEFLQALQDRKDFYPCTVTYASGATYGGLGQITGETQFSNASTTASVSLMGPGKLTAQ